MTRRARIVMVMAAVVAAMTVAPAFAATTPIPKVDVNAPVQSGDQCMPCHAKLDDDLAPGLKFSHGSHMTLSCDACHWAPPHTGGGTVLPSMQSCFNCHGLKHGGKVIARSDCGACHTTPRSQLRPADHTADWKGAPHGASADADSNRCLMCHDAATCDDCHVKENVDTPKTQPAYVPLLPGKPRKPAIDVEPGGLVTIGQCIACHPDLDAFIPGSVIFAHAVHLQKAFACQDCHRSFPHGTDGTSRPDMPACYQCHGLQHAKLGLVATDQCADCHPKKFVLKPADHTDAFVKGGHKVEANSSRQQCSMCHAASFCVDCHQGRPATPGGPARPQVQPADHRLASFKTQHGKQFLAQKGACGSCHDSASCERCHTTTMPHPPDWTSAHALATDLDSADCDVCHTDRSTCQECHHKNLHGADLVLKNCIACHPVMATQPATAIKDTGFVEHAVHFQVAQKKGKPYKCEQCHVGSGFTFVGTSEVRQNVSQGHDLRSCYQCHGALDYQNVQIAPYPGSSLCVRCHKNLNL